MDKLANKLTKFLLVPAASFLMALSVYAAPTNTIDYEKEEMTVANAAAGAEYSLNKSTWTPLLGDKIDLSTLIGKTIYLREVGKTTAADIATVAISRRPSAPTGIAFAPDGSAFAGPQADKITILDTHEYKVDNLDWHAGTASGFVVGEAEKLGASFSVRTPADNDTTVFASAATTVKVPKKDAAPAVVFDEKKDTITVKIGQEFKVSKASATWYAPTGTDLVINRDVTGTVAANLCTSGDLTDLVEDGVTKKFVYVRVKGTATKSASDIARVQFPDAEETLPTGVMDIKNEKITDVTATMEYRVLTNDQSKNGGSATYSWPAWTAVTGSEINLANAFSPNTTTGGAIKDQIEVRYKAVPASGKAVAKPASTAQEFTITKRQAAPTLASIDFNYATYNDESFGVVTTVQYKIGTNGEWVTGLGDNDVTTKVKDLFPPTGSTPIIMRTEATFANPLYTPASVEFKSSYVALAARPKTPTAKFTAYSSTRNEISNITKTMEYTDPDATTGNGGDPLGSNPETDAFVAVTAIPTPIAGKMDTSRDVKIRVTTIPYEGTAAPYKMAVPYSDEQTLTCEFLNSVTDFSGDIAVSPVNLAGAPDTEVARLTMPNYLVNGAKGENPTLTYAFGSSLPSGLTTGAGGNVTITNADNVGKIAVAASKTIAAGTYVIPITVTYDDDFITPLTYSQEIVITITKPLGARITGIGTVATVLQKTDGTARTAATTEASPAWTSSDTAVATINASTGLIAVVNAGTTTISYEATNGKINSVTVTVYAAAATTTVPAYAAITVGSKALPTNATTIATAVGTKTAAFTSSAPTKVSVNLTTGEITGVAADAATTITLIITDPATGQITHKATSSAITCTA